MNGHKPFPISNFELGEFRARESWLSPAAAFREMINARTFRGQIVKRSGRSRFAEISDDTTATRVINLSSGPTTAGYSALFGLPLRPVPESVIFDDDCGAAGATVYAVLANERESRTGDPIGWGWEWDIVAQGTTDILGTAWYFPDITPNQWGAIIDWGLHPDYDSPSADKGYVSYFENPKTDITGLFRFDENYLATDPDNLYKYDLTNKFYKKQGFTGSGFTGPFTGGSQDFFWFWPVDGKVFLTNNVDPVCVWDPTAVANASIQEFDSDWVTPSTNEMDTCRLVVQLGGRTVFINTVENTTRYGGRMRWTDAGTTTFRSSLDFADAPSEMGDAVDAALIGKRLFVAFENGWMEIVRTGQEVGALTWEPVVSRFGAVGTHSSIPDSERILSRSHTSMQQVDPNGQVTLDVNVPDFLLNYSSKYKHLCFGVRFEAERSFLWTAVSRAGEESDRIICASYDEQNRLAWSSYDFGMNVFSTFDKQGFVTLNSISLTWNQVDATWDQLGSGAEGEDILIGGKHNGTIYMIDPTIGKDAGEKGFESIPLKLVSQRLFPINGFRSHLGWVDLMVETSQPVKLRLTFSADEQETGYKTVDVKLTPSSSANKAYARVLVNRTATFHRIQVESLDDQPFAIDAIVPWFKQAGRIRNF